MAKIKEDLQKSIQGINDLAKLKNNIEITVTSEGLRIELLESENGTFFDSGSSTLNKSGQQIATLLAAELGRDPNRLSIEGHTDAKPFAGKSSYSNWELSADRANAARRLMQQSGLRPDQVSQVRGFADQRLRNKKIRWTRRTGAFRSSCRPSTRTPPAMTPAKANLRERRRKNRVLQNPQLPAGRRDLNPQGKKTVSKKEGRPWWPARKIALVI